MMPGRKGVAMFSGPLFGVQSTLRLLSHTFGRGLPVEVFIPWEEA